MSEVVAVVGAQFGSEAKGAVVGAVADRFDVHVRTGAPNAGHTVFSDGTPYVMRSVPCGFINRNARLIIGPGALLDFDLLKEEVESLNAAGWDVSSRLFVDPRAGLIDPMLHHKMEGGVQGRAHQQIGSTGEGVGPARMARIARGTFPDAWAKFDQVEVYREQFSEFCTVADTEVLLNGLYDLGESILLEGAQGSGLSLVTGPWPYCTSTDTNAGQLAVDAGLSPSLVDRTILVARTFPIRVAGNSGPLYRETTWAALNLEEERTTVTKKVRRVGHWDDNLLAKSVRLNRPVEVALTFVNYLGVQEDMLQPNRDVSEWDGLTSVVHEFVAQVESEHGVPITMVGTGPATVIHRESAVVW